MKQISLRIETQLQNDFRPIHLYLIFEKSSLKNQVRQTRFLTCFLQATQAVKIKFEMD